MAFDAEERSRDMCLLETGEEEGVYLASFNHDVLRKYREREVWGNTFRRPRRYESLTSTQIRTSFGR